jgi:hypothetical protein
MPTSSVFWRKRGNFIDFIGGATGDVIAYEYISNYPFANSGGTPKITPTADSDVFLLPEELIVLGAVWRYRSAKGYDYSQEVDAYEGEFMRAVADDADKSPLQLSRRGPSRASQMPFVITAP